MPRPLARVLALLEILQSGELHKLADLSDRLSVDERTVRRYVAHLLDLDIPVESVRGRYGGYRLGAGYRLPPLMLTDDEALSVLVGLSAGGATASEGRATATAKILRVLPAASRARFEALLRAADLTGSRRHPAHDAVAPATSTLLEVAEAAGSRRPLRVTYTDRDGRGSHRILLPYGLLARSGRWYLSAADSLSGEVRTFRVDRIGSVEPQDGHFEVPTTFDPESVRPAWRHLVSVRVEGTREHVLSRLPEGLATVRELTDAEAGAAGPGFTGWVRVELRAERLDWVPARLAGLDLPFIVDEPAELRDRVRALGERLVEISRAT